MSSRIQPQSKPVKKATKPKGEWIETETGNKISRRSDLDGLLHIVLKGRVVVSPIACLRGDLVRPAPSPPINSNAPPPASNPRTSISVGKYTFIDEGATLHPPCLVTSKETVGQPGEPAMTTQFIPMTLGSHIYVGPNAYISAASIGSHCYIGAGAVLGNACILGERVRVCNGAVIPAGMAIPSDVVVAGKPARVVGEVGWGWGLGLEYGAGEEDDGDGVNSDGEAMKEVEWVEGGELKALWRSVNR